MSAPTSMLTKTCRYPLNPLQINGTQAPNTTVCPDSCYCAYCRISDKHSVSSRHEVYCNKRPYTHIPSASIPVDVGDLFMNQNYIVGISGDSLVHFTQLQTLYLNYNSLLSSEMDDHIFDSQVNLKSLHLDYNRGLVNIRKSWFLKLVSLQSIYIQHSVVKTLEKGLFDNCLQLQTISLTGNQIAKLPINIFHNLPFLKNIDIESNDIGLLPSYLFLGSPNVTRFFVQKNKVTTISQKIGFQELTKLIALGIEYNPLVCDCNLVWFRNWINQTKATLVELEHATCKNKDGISLVSFDANSLRCYVFLIDLLFRLCVDFRDFVVGGAIADNISDAIKYSRKMLIVVTKNFAKSEWCYFEMEMARTRMFDHHEDILVVVILEHVASRNMPTLLQKILRKKTYIEWTENPDGQKVFWTRLAAALNTPNAHHDRLLN
ncbi:platelet glycoprotein Ib alpha chain-like [Anneissia japonica]|uniref:platelet glycoprotein Ib alpha chain-like n=1 Tax=Anneissia japonica TaxID=1529436 RepID=UPI0014256617|nr:platelet glycoprotein Ib alpha chain-like [Anneissia japonica]